MSTESLRLGSLAVHERIGRGELGLVYRGAHDEGAEVAIKVFAGLRPQRQAALRAQLRAVARLNHPGVMRLFHYGSVGAAVAEEAAWPAGSLYVVSELAKSALELKSIVTWGIAERVIGQLLAALAHAHSRGVLHLGLQPDNLLVVSEPRRSLQIKVSDFGIARAIGFGTGAAPAGWGSLAYLAPEQLSDGGSALGPGTDLYAVGCLVHELVTGRAPFADLEDGQALRARRAGELPKFLPRFRVPPGLEQWLQTLLRPNMVQRYACAADASYALMGLGPATMDPVKGAEVSTRSRRGGRVRRRRPARERARSSDAVQSLIPVSPPPPESWKDLPASPRPSRLPGTGWVLQGLAGGGASGPAKAQERLWLRLMDATPPRVVVLRGTGADQGRALARWLCETAGELGAAEVLTATHNPFGGPRDGLAAMLARYLGLAGVPEAVAGQEIMARREWLGLSTTAETHTLAAMLEPQLQLPAGRALRQPCTRAERHTVLNKLIRTMAARKPVLVWLDQAQWSAEALSWVQQTLDTLKGVRLCVVLTVRDDLLEQRPAEGQNIAELLEHRSVEALKINAASVNWGRRLGFLSAGPDGQRAAFELAACLGQEVDFREWAQACARSKLTPALRLTEMLAQLGVLDEPSGLSGWSFSSGGALDAVAALAADSGRAAAHHLQVARVVAQGRRPADSERLGRHLVAAGQVARGVEALTDVAAARRHQGDLDIAEALLQVSFEALHKAKTSASAPIWGRVQHERAELRVGQGDLAGAFKELSRLEQMAERFHWGTLQVEAATSRALLEVSRGDIQGANKALSAVPPIALTSASGTAMGRRARAIAHLRLNQGDLKEAEAQFVEGERLAREVGDDKGVASCMGGRVTVATRNGDLVTARSLGRQALQRFKEVGSRRNVAEIHTRLGEVARLRGDLLTAEEHYREGLEAMEAMGSARAVFPRVNLGLVLLRRGDVEGADEHLGKAQSTFEQRGQRSFAAKTRVYRLSCAARRKRWGVWDELISGVEGTIDAGQHGDAELAELAELAAGLARDEGEKERSNDAARIALGQLRRLKDEDGVDRLMGMLG